MGLGGSYPSSEINQDSTGAPNDQLKERVTSPNKIEHRQIITQRIVKDQEKVDQFFNEKAEQLKNIASYQRQ